MKGDSLGISVRKAGDKDNRFCIFAVRVNANGSTGQRKLIAQKPYYLMKGFSIEGDIVKIEKDVLSLLKSEMYGNILTDTPTYKPAVNISAIVGENGSGKSTVVEYIIRLINNLSASAFGEIKISDSSDRLHFIDGVEGELFYMQYGRVYSIRIENDSAKLRVYEPIKELCTDKVDVQKACGTFYDNHRDGQGKSHELFRSLGITDDFKRLFYTIVSNHSIYAYNTNDYPSEINSDKMEMKAEVLYRQSFAERTNRIGGVKAVYPIDQKCWLHGLFHKNDGYQVPLVLTPYRSEGIIDINTENKLANERLVALIVDEKSNFRVINEHLKVESLSVTRSNVVYDYKRFKKQLKLSAISVEIYSELKHKIKEIWWARLGFPAELGKDKKYYNDAISYLAYKTVKVSKQYQQYGFFYKRFKNSGYQLNEQDLERLIDNMILDSSHITAKIFQTLAYIGYNIYTDEVVSRPIIPEDLKAVNHPRTLANNKIVGLLLFNMQREKLIPAPIFDVTINLRDTFSNEQVPFETISSGEKQLTYAVSSLLYHLVNIDSVKNDNNGLRIVYDHVNIILEEIELYFHPDLQRRFVKYLLDSLNTIRFDSIKGLNIILVTHSPFVLSDIPSNNIVALNKDGSQKDSVKSFGANIHEMLADSFFLKDGSIGEYARWYINEIIEELEGENSDVDCLELYRKIMLIDEPVIQMTLLEQLRMKSPQLADRIREEEILKELEEIRKRNVEA